jgi:hypothetical protein
MIQEENNKRPPPSEWQRTKIMRPIRNMANTEKTLHAAECLTMDNIKIQKKMYEGGLKTVDEQYRFEQNNLGLNSSHFLTYGLKKHGKHQ